MDIILASQSEFRRQALDLLGLDYEAISSQVSEKSIRDEDPEKLAKRLAEAKAKDVGYDLEEGRLVVAGDLFILFQGEIYEKPETEEEARGMLKAFSGDEVKIISSVSVLNTNQGEINSSLGRARIEFRKLTSREINKYMADYPVLELAGAFEKDFVLKYAREVHGDLSFFTGFPLRELIKLLRENDIRL